ncbi:hypothetical protein EJ04DRAFT_483191 [Polyplosphaeria fusca]|uniref:Uncharacterized protein n=1 Tax=Polyplosphaeria fusca TaxID=682080 RepID=A0A9P4RAK2_9PLEO|nr:hypothetical protein EJ04DRAFT_483191 [Polyplosphaeria fusca]
MLFLEIFLLPLVSAYAVRTEREIPILKEGDLTSGIGVHFTSSYAVAAIAYGNGTVEDLVRVDGNAQYNDLIRRWSDKNNFRRCEYPSTQERTQCQIMHADRELNKGLGYPATEDVGILASIMEEVKTSIERTLGIQVTAFQPVFPVLRGLNKEDVDDAMEHVGLDGINTAIKDHPFWGTHWETTASYAGAGFGLCNTWTDIRACVDEGMQLDYEEAMFLNFDNSSFAAALQFVHPIFAPKLRALETDFSLGWWNLPVYEIPRAKFWARIQEAIVDVANTLGPRTIPKKIILLGDHAQDPEFLETVKAAFWELLEFDVELLLQDNEGRDGLMLAARGAAELAMTTSYWASHDASEREEVSEL